MADFIDKCSKNRIEMQLIPDDKSAESRKGFEIFSPIIQDLLYATIFYFLVFYLMRLQIVYKTSSAPDVYSFIGNEIGIGFFRNLWDLIKQGNPDLFDIGRNMDFTTVIALAATGLAISFAILIPVVILKQAAERSKNNYFAAYGRPIESMTFWPMKYPRENQLILFSLFAVICFVFYRFGMIFIGSIIYIIVDKIFNLPGKRLSMQNDSGG